MRGGGADARARSSTARTAKAELRRRCVAAGGSRAVRHGRGGSGGGVRRGGASCSARYRRDKAVAEGGVTASRSVKHAGDGVEDAEQLADDGDDENTVDTHLGPHGSEVCLGGELVPVGGGGLVYSFDDGLRLVGVEAGIAKALRGADGIEVCRGHGVRTGPAVRCPVAGYPLRRHRAPACRASPSPATCRGKAGPYRCRATASDP